jgi:hypothetical protein
MGELSVSLHAHKLDVDLQANNLPSRWKELADRERELADKEKRLAEKQLQELATARKRLEELQTVQVADMQKVWDFLGQTETTLLHLGFSQLCSGEPVQELSTILPLLDFVGAKMLKLEEVVCDQLETEGHILAEKVAEHVPMCFWSRGPIISLDPVVFRPIAGIEEATSNDF